MTTNLFVIANVKQLRSQVVLEFYCLFFRTAWGVGTINSAIFNSFRNFGGGVGDEPRPRPRYATVGRVILDFDKYIFHWQTNFFVGGHLRLESYCIWVNMVISLSADIYSLIMDTLQPKQVVRSEVARFEGDHSPPSAAEVKNVRHYTPTPHVPVWCL